MHNYTSERQNHWAYILKQWLISLAVFSLPVIYDLLFPTDYIKDTYYWIAAGLLLVRLVDLISRPTIYRIVIDETAKTIAQYYSSPFSGQGEKIILMDKIQLYIKKTTSPSIGESLPTSLIMYKDRREFLRLNANKDGFSINTLKAISDTLQRLGVPVTE
jgi:hypothetical protein